MLDRIDTPVLPRAALRPRTVARAPVAVPRRIPGGVAASLDALPGAALPRLGYEGPMAGLRRDLRAAVLGALPRPRWLALWLINDALALAARAADLGGVASVRASLGTELPALGPGPGPRLVAVYRGPGFGGVARGEVAILHGAGSGLPGRALPAGSEAALVLVVDALAPAPLRQPPNSRSSIASQSRST